MAMEEVPRDEWEGPLRLRSATLDDIMVPGNKWHELQAGVDFSTRVPRTTIRTHLYGAARRRGGGQLSVYFTDNGNIRVYATGCHF